MSATRFQLPTDRHYDTQQHLWVQESEGRVRLGLDTVGLNQLGSLAYVALKDVGTEVGKGESLGTLEAAKMTATIAAPVAGRVVERNELVLADPSRVGQDAYGEGWLLVLEAKDWAEDSTSLVGPDGVQAYHDAEVERENAEKVDE